MTSCLTHKKWKVCGETGFADTIVFEMTVEVLDLGQFRRRIKFWKGLLFGCELWPTYVQFYVEFLQYIHVLNDTVPCKLIHTLEKDISNIFSDYQNAMLDMELYQFLWG